MVSGECYTAYVLRLLVFGGHVIVEWSDAILSSVMTAIRRVVRCVCVTNVAEWVLFVTEWPWNKRIKILRRCLNHLYLP